MVSKINLSRLQPVSILAVLLLFILVSLSLACGGGGGGGSDSAPSAPSAASVTPVEQVADTSTSVGVVARTSAKISIDLADYQLLKNKSAKFRSKSKASTLEQVKRVTITVRSSSGLLFEQLELVHISGTRYEVLLSQLPVAEPLSFELEAVDATGQRVLKAVTETTIPVERATESSTPTLSVPILAVIELEGVTFTREEVEQVLASQSDIPVADTPSVETPVADTPNAETPVADTPVAETPVAETPSVETPSVETPVAETPIVETPVADTPSAETPVAETPSAEPPVAESGNEIIGGAKGDDSWLSLVVYDMTELSDGVRTSNEKNGFWADIKNGKILLGQQAGEHLLSTAPLSYGRSGQAQPLSQPSQALSAKRLTQSWGSFESYYENREDGLEQVFIVRDKPQGAGDLEVQMQTDADQLLLADGRITMQKLGRTFAYDKLYVFDADGSALSATFRIDSPQLFSIVVDDTLAKYPITIDPTYTLISDTNIVIEYQSSGAGVIDSIDVGFPSTIQADNTQLADWSVTYNGGAVSLASKTTTATNVVTLSLTNAIKDTAIDLFRVQHSATNANDLVVFNGSTTAAGNFDSNTNITNVDVAEPALLSVDVSQGAVPAGQTLTGYTLNTLTLTYSEPVSVDAGAISTASSSFSDANLGASTTANTISGLLQHSATNSEDLISLSATDHLITMSASNVIVVYFNASPTSYFTSTTKALVAATTITAVADTDDVKGSADGLAVSTSNTPSVSVTTAWDVTAPTVHKFYTLDKNPSLELGWIDTVEVGTSESIVDTNLRENRIYLDSDATPGGDQQTPAVSSYEVAYVEANATQGDNLFQLRFTNEVFGTNVKYLHVTTGAFRDHCGNPVANASATGTCVDMAAPVLLGADFTMSSAPSGSELSGNSLNSVSFGYSEAVSVSGLTEGQSKASTATLGAMTTAATVAGVGSWANGGDMVVSEATAHHIEHSSANTITLYLNAMNLGYFSGGSTAPATGLVPSSVSSVDAASFIQDAVGLGASGNTVTTGITVTTSWDVTAPSLSTLNTYDSDADGSVDGADLIFNTSVLDASILTGSYILEDPTTSTQVNASSSSTIITTPSVSTTNDTGFALNFAELEGSGKKILNYTRPAGYGLRDHAGNRVASFTSSQSTDLSQPVLMSAKFSTGTGLTGMDLSGYTLNTLELQYSENVILNNGSNVIAVGTHDDSSSSLGSMVSNSANIVGLVAWSGASSGNMQSNGHGDHRIYHSTANTLMVYFNANSAGYFQNTGDVAPTTPSVVAADSSAVLQDESGLGVAYTVGSPVTATSENPWDVQIPEVADTYSFDTTDNGKINLVDVVFTESVLDVSVVNSTFTLDDITSVGNVVTASSNSTTGVNVTVSNDKYFQFNFSSELGGTGNKILKYTEGTARDLAGNKLPTSSANWSHDRAAPVLLYMSLQNEDAPSFSFMGSSNLVNYTELTYSENVMISMANTGVVDLFNDVAVSNSNLGIIADGEPNYLKGLASWNTLSNRDLMNNKNDANHVYSSNHFVRVYYNTADPQGYFVENNSNLYRYPSTSVLQSVSSPSLVFDQQGHGVSATYAPQEITPYDFIRNRPSVSLAQINGAAATSTLSSYDLPTMRFQYGGVGTPLFTGNAEYYVTSDNAMYQNGSSDNMYIVPTGYSSFGLVGFTFGGVGSERLKSGNLTVGVTTNQRDSYGYTIYAPREFTVYVEAGNVAHYSFESGSAATVLDLIPSTDPCYTAGFNGTLTGSRQTESDGFVIDGQSAAVTSLQVEELDRRNFPQPKGTVEFWYHTVDAPSTADVIFGAARDTSSDYYGLRYSGTGNTFTWAAHSASIASGNTIDFDMALSTWHHISFYYNDEGTANLILNGVMQTAGMSNITGFNPVDQDFVFASSNIDSVRLLDIYKPEADIRSEISPLLTASYPFDDMTGADYITGNTIVTDIDHDFDGALYNMASSNIAEGHHRSGNSVHLSMSSSGNMIFDTVKMRDHLFPHLIEGSLAFWYRPNRMARSDAYVLDVPDTTRNHFVIQGTGNLDQYRWTVQQNGSELASSEFILQDYAWNHLGMTWSRSGDVTLYVNGSANASVASGGWGPDGQAVRFEPNGYLDNLVIKDTILSAGNFYTEFNTYHTPSANYSFDDHIASANLNDVNIEYLRDDTGNHHDAYFAGGTPSLDEPHYGEVSGNSLHFGTDVGMSVYSLESQFFPSANGTIAFWWKPDYRDEASGNVEVLDTDSGLARNQLYIESSDNVGNYRMAIVKPSLGGELDHDFKPIMERWNHIAVTWGDESGGDSDRVKFYLNGNLELTHNAGSWRPTDQILASTPHGSLDDLYLHDFVWPAANIGLEYFGSVKNTMEYFYLTGNTTAPANIYYGFATDEIIADHSFATNLMSERSGVGSLITNTAPYNYARFNAQFSSNTGHHRFLDDADMSEPDSLEDPLAVIGVGAKEFATGEDIWVPSLDKLRFPQEKGTLRFWFKPVPGYSGKDVVFGGNFEDTRKHANFFRMVESTTDGYYDFEVYENGVLKTAASVGSIELHPNVYNYICVTWDKDLDKIDLFVNGYSKFTSGTPSMGTWRPSDQLFVSTPNGTLDMLHLENVSRDQDYIRNYYFLTYVTPAGTYNFDQNTLDVNANPATANDGTSSGTSLDSSITLYSGGNNSALNLTASSSFFEVASLQKDLFPQDEGIVRFWYYPDPTSTHIDKACLLDIEDATRPHFYIIPQGADHGSYRFGIQGVSPYRHDTFDFNLRDKTLASANDWNHVAINWSSDRGVINLMIDGQVRYTTDLGTWRPEKQYVVSTPAGYLDDFYVNYLPQSIHEVEDYVHQFIPEPVASSLYEWGAGQSGQLGNNAFSNVAQPQLNHEFSEVIKVAGGDKFGVAILKNGMLQSWGTNNRGQLGDNTMINRVSPVDIALVNGVVDVDCGADFAIAVLSNGNVMAWGANDRKQLGPATTADNSMLPLMVHGVDGIQAVACGNAHTLLLGRDGNVYAWGANDSGQADGAGTSDVSALQTLYNGGAATKVAAGMKHSMVLVSQAVNFYGSNAEGQAPGTNLETNVSDIACGDYHSIALKSGEVVAWGKNDQGQLGNNTKTSTSSTTAVSVFMTSDSSANVNLSGVTEVAAGGDTSYALLSDNTLMSWGRGNEGQLGNGLNQKLFAGNVGVATNVMLLGKSGRYHMQSIVDKAAYPALFTEREVKLSFDNNTADDVGLYNFDAWFSGSPTSGNGHSGNIQGKGKALKFEGDEYLKVDALSGNIFPQETGTFSLWYKPSSTTATGANLLGAGNAYDHFNMTYLGSSQVRISMIDDLASPPLASQDLNVTLDAWNHLAFSWDATNGTFVTSNNGSTNTFSVTYGAWRPSDQIFVSTPSGWIDNVELTSTAMAAADLVNEYENGLSLFAGEFVSGWGDNSYGQLQDGTTLDKLSPVLSTGLEDPAAVGIGVDHVAVLLANGVVKTKGLGIEGQLGAGGTTTYHADLTAINLGGSATQLGVGDHHNVVLLSDGTVQTWGKNQFGQLGTGSPFNSYSLPVTISTLSSVMDISVGLDHSMALVQNTGAGLNEVWTWGRNTNGQLGNGTFVDQNAPVKVSLAANIISISAGAEHCTVLTSTGLVYSWGENKYGQLGNGSTSDSSSPVQVTNGLGGITMIASGSTFSLAYDGTSHKLYGWGNSSFGQLGSITTSQTTFVNLSDAPLSMVPAGVTAISQMVAGKSHALILSSDKTVYAWGRNEQGQLGIGTTDLYKSTLTQISGLSNVLKILSKGSSSYAIGQ